MPRRSLDREALLKALTPHIRVGVEAAVEAMGLWSHWEGSPTVARFVELAALACEIERLREEEGLPEYRAADFACAALGLPESAFKQLKRQRARSRKPANDWGQKGPKDPARAPLGLERRHPNRGDAA